MTWCERTLSFSLRGFWETLQSHEFENSCAKAIAIVNNLEDGIERKWTVRDGVDDSLLGSTPLILATIADRPDVMKALLLAGAQVNVVNCDGMNALLIAAKQGNVASVELLIASGADPNFTYFSTLAYCNRNSPLHYAALNGNAAAIRALVRGGATTINAVNSNIQTPLHLAASNDNVDAIRIFVAFGANTEALDLLQQTALFNAACNGHVNSIQVLVDSGAVVDTVDRNGNSPLELASRRYMLGVVKVLNMEGVIEY